MLITSIWPIGRVLKNHVKNDFVHAHAQGVKNDFVHAQIVSAKLYFAHAQTHAQTLIWNVYLIKNWKKKN